MQELLSKPVVELLKGQISKRAGDLIDRGIEPHVAVILVGDHEASLKYVSKKQEMAKEVGIILSLYHLEAGTPFEDVRQTIDFLSTDDEVHGIILQLPLPETFTPHQTEELIAAIASEKDVDGLKGDWTHLSYSGVTLSDLQARQTYALPPMVLAVTSLLDHYKIDLTGKKIVLVGKGRLVGAPLEQFFRALHLDVHAVDEETENILSITKEADILISGTGEDNLITYQWVKDAAVVIDCAADVHRDSVDQVASAVAPAKGGVGPLTVSWLLWNTIQATSMEVYE